MSEALAMWTVYDHPRDAPDKFVARKFLINGDGSRPTADVIMSPSLESLRHVLTRWGLTPINRSPGDDPVIIETWL